METPPVPPAPARKPNTRLAAVVLLVGVCAAGFAFTRKKHPGESALEARKPALQAAPPEVPVEAVTASYMSRPIRVTGTLKTDETVTLSTPATGVVRKVLAKEGDRVRAGQLLVVIDADDLVAQRDRAVAAVRAAESQIKENEAAVHSAEARLEQAKTSRQIKDVGADSDYRRAQDGLSTAKARLEQAKSLAEIAKTEADTRVSSAAAELQAAAERLKALREGSRKQEKLAAEAQVSRAQAQVARTKSLLDRRKQLLDDRAVAAEVVENAQRDYEAAAADLNAAKQQLSLVNEGPRTEEIRAQEEVVRQAQGAVRDAEANRARREISNQDVEAAEAQLRQARATLEAAKANLNQSRWNEDEIRNTEAALNQARAKLDTSRSTANQARADVRFQDEKIRQTKVYSPVNGVVTRRSVQVGAAVVQMRNELMDLVSAESLYFEATAPETVLVDLRQGLPAKVVLDALPGKTLPGVVREIIPVAEGNNRSVRLRISIPHPPQGQSVVGGFARALIRGRSGGAAISVPRAAVVSDEGETAVFVVEDGKAVRRPVTVSDFGGVGERIPVTAGLREGENVVTEGAASLTDGQHVTVRKR